MDKKKIELIILQTLMAQGVSDPVKTMNEIKDKVFAVLRYYEESPVASQNSFNFDDFDNIQKEILYRIHSGGANRDDLLEIVREDKDDHKHAQAKLKGHLSWISNRSNKGIEKKGRGDKAEYKLKKEFLELVSPYLKKKRN